MWFLITQHLLLLQKLRYQLLSTTSISVEPLDILNVDLHLSTTTQTVETLVVNQFSNDDQQNSEVAYLSDSRSVVAWQLLRGNGHINIYMSVFSADGTALVSSFW